MKNKNYSDYPLNREMLNESGDGPIATSLKTLADKFNLIRPEEEGGFDSVDYINRIGDSTTLQLFYDGSIDAHFYSKDGTYLGAVVCSEHGESSDEAPQGVFIQSDESDELKFNEKDSMVYVHNLTSEQIDTLLGMLTPAEN